MNGRRILIAVGALLFITLLRYMLPREGELLTGALAACITAEGTEALWLR